jgi:hypothetical protein
MVGPAVSWQCLCNEMQGSAGQRHHYMRSSMLVATTGTSPPWHVMWACAVLARHPQPYAVLEMTSSD